MAVDPSNGNVYVTDGFSTVDEYTGTGQFVLRIGKEVNAIKDSTTGATVAEKNLCTAVSGDTCKGAASSELGTTEPAAIRNSEVMAAGGPEDLLYVGDEHRVQEFEADGKYKREIPLTSILSTPESMVTALTVDTAGELYLIYRHVAEGRNVIRRFNSGGEETGKLTVNRKEPNPNAESVEVGTQGIALDSAGRLAVSERERIPFPGTGDRFFGTLYQAETFRPITEFSVPGFVGGLAFTPNGELFANRENGVLSYVPVPVAELVASPATCGAGGEQESDVTLSCALAGEVNPEGVSETEVWFGWGRTPVLGSTTPARPVASGEALVPVSAPVEGLRPSETFYYRLEGHDHNVKAPEALGSETRSFTTPTVAPRVLGEPAVSFVGSSSAVMSGVLNPENDSTHYQFQYGACETLDTCPGAGETGSLESAFYGKVPTTLEAKGLQPGTVYHYRLTAENTGGVARGVEGQFTTAPAPVVGAVTGSAGGVGVGSAVISGAVSPDGQPAVYAFELGIANGSATQFGVVFSGQVPGSSALVPESLALSGLQPGVTYAYRIAVHSGYGSAVGETVTFTTQGLPAVLVSPVAPALLAVPAVAFPRVESPLRVKAKPKQTKAKRSKKAKKTKKGKKGKRTGKR